jgi:CRISPR system Cascade subunit CasE
MYLSQLTLDPGQPQARRDLANRYELHRTLCRAFDAPASARPLWRLELLRPGEPPRLLVQSRAAPDWARLHAEYPGYLADARSKPLALADQLAPDLRLRFRLEANPTVTRAGKRHGLWREADQLDWLQRQAERAGVALDAAVVTREERLTLRKPGQPRPIVLHAVTYDGRLVVAEPARLAAALDTGLGHGKALGLGLLSLGRG